MKGLLYVLFTLAEIWVLRYFFGDGLYPLLVFGIVKFSLGLYIIRTILYQCDTTKVDCK